MITQKLLAISLFGTEWILYLLVLFSVFSWAIIVERAIFLLKNKGDIEQIENSIQGFLEQGEIEKAVQLLKQDRSSAASIAMKLMAHVTKKGAEAEEYM